MENCKVWKRCHHILAMLKNKINSSTGLFQYLWSGTPPKHTQRGQGASGKLICMHPGMQAHTHMDCRHKAILFCWLGRSQVLEDTRQCWIRFLCFPGGAPRLGGAVLPCPLLPYHSPTRQDWAGQASPVEDNAQEGASSALGVVLASRRGGGQLAWTHAPGQNWLGRTLIKG